jgi:hypothetical protein
MSEKYGFVYVLRNDCMPGIYKIGMTDRSPSQRCEELSSSTAVPTPYEIVCFVETIDARGLEQFIHEAIEEKRISLNREFFVLSGEDLADVFRALEEEATFCAYGDLSFLFNKQRRPLLRDAAAREMVSDNSILSKLPSASHNAIAMAMVDAASKNFDQGVC